MPPNCQQESLACRVKRLEGERQVSQHPPAVITYGGTAFNWDSASQSGNIPILQTWTFEAVNPEQELEASTDRIYLHHAPTGMLISEGIRINSSVPGSAGLSVQIFTGGVAMFAAPVSLTGGTVLIPATAIVANQRTLLAGEVLEIQVVTEQPGYGAWYGLSVDFIGYADLQSGSAGLPPFNLLPPVISGFTVAGSLIQSVVGAWTNNPASYSYQWYRSGVAISGATQPTYTISSPDQGLAIQLRVTATNIYGSTATLSNILVADNPAAVPQNLTVPVITGAASVGGTLTASTGTWTASPSAYTFQWKVNGVNVAGATSSNYVIQAGDSGGVITVAVTAANTNGASSPAMSGGITVSNTSAALIHWGRSSLDILTEADVLALSNSLSATTPSGTFNYTAGTSSYLYFVVPGSLTSPAEIKLSSSNTNLALAVSPDFPDYSSSVNGLSYMPITISGSSYKIYRSYNTIASAGGIIVTI